jgi:hypothetical protein
MQLPKQASLIGVLLKGMRQGYLQQMALLRLL